MANNVRKQLNYEVRLQAGTDEFSGKGENILEAMEAMKEKVGDNQFKAQGSFTVRFQDKWTPTPVKMTPLRLKRLFNNKTDLQIIAKKLSTFA